jgi:hypothetical protein
VLWEEDIIRYLESNSLPVFSFRSSDKIPKPLWREIFGLGPLATLKTARFGWAQNRMVAKGIKCLAMVRPLESHLLPLGQSEANSRRNGGPKEKPPIPPAATV